MTEGIYVVGQKIYRDADLSSLGTTWGTAHNPSPWLGLRSLEIGQVWDVRKLDGVHLPEVLGVSPADAFYKGGSPSVLDLPIKMPGTGYRLPVDLDQFYPLIRSLSRVEHGSNRLVDQYHAYLTIDQGWVEAGETQRTGGWHVDGFQGARIEEKVAIDHSYISQDCLPTLFSSMPFQLSQLDPERDNFFHEMDRQVVHSSTRNHSLGAILFMDAYTVHRADVALERTFRTFFRLTYSVRQFDRLGNTHNPMFNYDWDMVARDFGL